MALAVCTVRKWRGPSPQATYKKKFSSSNTQDWLLNTKQMFKVEDQTSYRSLYYVDNLYGIRQQGNYMELTDTLTLIKTHYNSSYQNEYLQLPVFTDNDPSKSTVNRLIPAESVTAAVADNRASTRSWLWYAEGSKSIKVLVDYTLHQIEYLSDEGSTTSSA